jgi:hypothetical protein
MRKSDAFTTIHVLGFHNDVASKEFACNVRIAWALLNNLNEDDAKFYNFSEC